MWWYVPDPIGAFYAMFGWWPYKACSLLSGDEEGGGYAVEGSREEARVKAERRNCNWQVIFEKRS